MCWRNANLDYVSVSVSGNAIVGSLLNVPPISAARTKTCSARFSLRKDALGRWIWPCLGVLCSLWDVRWSSIALIISDKTGIMGICSPQWGHVMHLLDLQLSSALFSFILRFAFGVTGCYGVFKIKVYVTCTYIAKSQKVRDCFSLGTWSWLQFVLWYLL